ncbi:BolA-like protein 2 [Orobanche gracilis]
MPFDYLDTGTRTGDPNPLLGTESNLQKLKTQAGSEEMAVTKEQVESTLKSKLNPSKLEVIEPPGGCGAYFTIEIVSKEFEGKRLLERHRLINCALEEEMKQIHALSILKAQTPEEWERQETRKSHPTA